jgi:hypothetical protein
MFSSVKWDKSNIEHIHICIDEIIPKILSTEVGPWAALKNYIKNITHAYIYTYTYVLTWYQNDNVYN